MSVQPVPYDTFQGPNGGSLVADGGPWLCQPSTADMSCSSNPTVFAIMDTTAPNGTYSVTFKSQVLVDLTQFDNTAIHTFTRTFTLAYGSESTATGSMLTVDSIIGNNTYTDTFAATNWTAAFTENNWNWVNIVHDGVLEMTENGTEGLIDLSITFPFNYVTGDANRLYMAPGKIQLIDPVVTASQTSTGALRPTTSGAASSDNSSKIGVIIGVVVGLVALFAAIGVGLFFFFRRRRMARRSMSDETKLTEEYGNSSPSTRPLMSIPPPMSNPSAGHMYYSEPPVQPVASTISYTNTTVPVGAYTPFPWNPDHTNANVGNTKPPTPPRQPTTLLPSISNADRPPAYRPDITSPTISAGFTGPSSNTTSDTHSRTYSSSNTSNPGVAGDALARFASENRNQITEELEQKLRSAGYVPTDNPDVYTEAEWEGRYGVGRLELLRLKALYERQRPTNRRGEKAQATRRSEQS